MSSTESLRSSSWQFLKAALNDPHQPINQASRTHTRHVNIAAIYSFTHASLESIGQAYGHLSKERIRQIVRRAIAVIHANGSASLQVHFPINSIEIAKDPSLPAIHPASITEIIPLIDDGRTYLEIKSQLGLSTYEISAARVTLKRHGYDLPYHYLVGSKSATIRETLATSTSDTEIQSLLDSLPIGYLFKHSGRDNLLFTNLSPILDCYHYHPSLTPRFIEALKSAHLPITHRRHALRKNGKTYFGHYHFLLARHVERARNILESHQEFDRFLTHPIAQICGPSVTTPSTWDMQKGEHYSRLFPLIRTLPIPPHVLLNRFRHHHDSCPVPVFHYQDFYFYPKAYEAQLREFLSLLASEITR